MTNGTLLKQFARSAAEGDLDAFRCIEKLVVAAERKWRHDLLANDLETPMYSRSQGPSMSLATSRNQPCG